tara:strand:+ start:286 stop:495 length:210 start_codon:yes stop_codon:yes gene_type:complete
MKIDQKENLCNTMRTDFMVDRLIKELRRRTQKIRKIEAGIRKQKTQLSKLKKKQAITDHKYWSSKRRKK